MYVTLRGLLAAAAVVVVVVAGVAFAARGGVPGAPGATQTPLPTASPLTGSPTPDALSGLIDYRAARDAICGDFASSPPIPDVSDWEADPEAAAAFLAAVIDRGEELIARLGGLEAPPEIAAAHAANVQTGRDTVALIEHELELVQAGDIQAALAVDAATGPLSAQFEQFEQQNGLVPCP